MLIALDTRDFDELAVYILKYKSNFINFTPAKFGRFKRTQAYQRLKLFLSFHDQWSSRKELDVQTLLDALFLFYSSINKSSITNAIYDLLAIICEQNPNFGGFGILGNYQINILKKIKLSSSDDYIDLTTDDEPSSNFIDLTEDEPSLNSGSIGILHKYQNDYLKKFNSLSNNFIDLAMDTSAPTTSTNFSELFEFVNTQIDNNQQSLNALNQISSFCPRFYQPIRAKQPIKNKNIKTNQIPAAQAYLKHNLDSQIDANYGIGESMV